MKIKFVLIFLMASMNCFFYAQKSKLMPEIKSIYFQHWMGGQEQTGGGTDFFVILKKPFSNSILLKKVYFEKSEANFEQRNDSLLVAYFRVVPNLKDLNSNENVAFKNQNPAKTDFKLKPNQAVLEFLINNKTKRIKIYNIKELAMLEYPSAPPKN